MNNTNGAAGANSFRVLELPSLKEGVRDMAGLRADFVKHGAVVLPDFFDDAQLDSVRNELNAHYAPLHENALGLLTTREDMQDKACDVIPWHPLGEGNVVMKELHDNAAMASATEAALGAGYSHGFGMVMYSVGGGRGQAWHQDCVPEQPTAFNLNRLIYPEDVSLEDGAIVFVPGSHRMGQIPPGGHQEPIEGEVTLTPKAGTLVLLNGQVYHRVTPNLNAKPRTSINFRAFPAGVSSSVVCVGVYRNGSVNFCDKPKTHDGKPVAMAMG